MLQDLCHLALEQVLLRQDEERFQANRTFLVDSDEEHGTDDEEDWQQSPASL